MERGTCKTRYPSTPIQDFTVVIILSKTPLDFFNFIDLQLRYRTSSISYPFNFKIPVITVFSRDTEGSGKQVFRVRDCVSAGARVCVCVCVCVCQYYCDQIER